MVLLGLVCASALAISPINLGIGQEVHGRQASPTASAEGSVGAMYSQRFGVTPDYSQRFDSRMRTYLDQTRWTDPTVSLVAVSYPGSELARGTQEQLKRDIDGHVSAFWGRELGEEFSLNVGRSGRIRVPSDPCQNPPTGDYALPKQGLLDAVREQLPTSFLTSRHLVLAWERSETCGNWAGMALMNHDPRDRGLLWINGPSSDTRIRQSVIAHEFGHAFGFGHANYLRCADSQGKRAADGPWTQCTSYEYGNTVDVMGSSGRLAPLSAAALVGTEWEPRLRAISLDPNRSSTVSLAPLTSDEGTRAGILRLRERTYVFEYRRAVAGNSALASDTYSQGEGVYLNVRIDSPSESSLDSDGQPESNSRASYALDGDLSTRDRHGQGSWHIPLYEPLKLASGGHLTVTKVGERATVHYSSPGEATPVPQRPTSPNRLRAEYAPGSVLEVDGHQAKHRQPIWVSWRGDGQGTDFILEARRGKVWVRVSYTPIKPGQPYVRASASLPRGAGVKVRVSAINEAGSSEFAYTKIR